MNNVFFFPHINEIGGVETFLYNIARKYGGTHDITVFYKTGDQAQIDRLREYVSIRKWDGKTTIKCKRLFVNYGAEIIDHADAEEIIQVIHADYKTMNLQPNLDERITKRIAVSELARDRFVEAGGPEPEVCYNPLAAAKPRKILRLVSATRLTQEKGRARIRKLANAMNDAGVLFEWTIYTTTNQAAIYAPNVITRPPRLDIADYIAAADYLVQLSDCEAYCYTVVEALSMGTPVIVTDLPVYNELGLDEKNSIRLPLEMEDLPIEKIRKGLPRVKGYKPPEDRWKEILAGGAPKYKKTIEVEATAEFMDLQANGKKRKPGERWRVPIARADLLEERGLAKRRSR